MSERAVGESRYLLGQEAGDGVEERDPDWGRVDGGGFADHLKLKLKLKLKLERLSVCWQCAMKGSLTLRVTRASHLWEVAGGASHSGEEGERARRQLEEGHVLGVDDVVAADQVPARGWRRGGGGRG